MKGERATNETMYHTPLSRPQTPLLGVEINDVLNFVSLLAGNSILGICKTNNALQAHIETKGVLWFPTRESHKAHKCSVRERIFFPMKKFSCVLYVVLKKPEKEFVFSLTTSPA